MFTTKRSNIYCYLSAALGPILLAAFVVLVGDESSSSVGGRFERDLRGGDRLRHLLSSILPLRRLYLLLPSSSRSRRRCRSGLYRSPFRFSIDVRLQCKTNTTLILTATYRSDRLLLLIAIVASLSN